MEDSSDFTDLISQIQVNDSCSVDDLVQSEEHTPVCSNLADNAWKNLLCRIRHKGKLSQWWRNSWKSNNEDEEGEHMAGQGVKYNVKVKNHSDAIESLENVQQFLEGKGHTK